MDKKYYTDPPSIWSIIFWCLFYAFCCTTVFMAPAIEGRENIKWLYIVFLVCFSLLYVRSYWNYPIIGHDFLEIKNLLFSSKLYDFRDIERVELIRANVYGTGLAIKLKNRHFRKSCYISCVAHKQLDDLYYELTQKGLEVVQR